MDIKTLYTNGGIFNKKLLGYLSNVKKNMPAIMVDGTSWYYYNDEKNVPLHPVDELSSIAMILDREKPIFGDLIKEGYKRI